LFRVGLHLSLQIPGSVDGSYVEGVSLGFGWVGRWSVGQIYFKSLPNGTYLMRPYIRWRIFKKCGVQCVSQSVQQPYIDKSSCMCLKCVGNPTPLPRFGGSVGINVHLSNKVVFPCECQSSYPSRCESLGFCGFFLHCSLASMMQEVFFLPTQGDNCWEKLC